MATDRKALGDAEWSIIERLWPQVVKGDLYACTVVLAILERRLVAMGVRDGDGSELAAEPG